MTTNRLDLLTPVGRLVQGDPFEAQTTNMKGKPLVDKNNQPRVEYFLAIAVPKSDPAVNEFWGQVQQMAAAAFTGGQSAHPDFSWKILDGDSPKCAGKEGFAGCWVIRMSSGYAIKVYKKVEGSADQFAQIVDPAQLKRGYYVRCYVSIKPNGCTATDEAGMYINPSMVELIGYGEEIQGGPDAAATFGAAPAALPAGASATPVAGAPLAAAAPPLPAAAAAPPLPAAAAAPPLPAAAPPLPVAPALPAAPAAPVAPAPDFLNPKQMTAKAAGATYESFIAANWTDQQLIDGGYMDIPF